MEGEGLQWRKWPLAKLFHRYWFVSYTDDTRCFAQEVYADLSKEGNELRNDIEKGIKKTLGSIWPSQAHPCVQETKTKPTPALPQKEPKARPFHLQLPVNQYVREDPVSIWTTWGKKSVPEGFFHLSNSQDSSSLPSAVVQQTIPHHSSSLYHNLAFEPKKAGGDPNTKWKQAFQLKN